MLVVKIRPNEWVQCEIISHILTVKWLENKKEQMPLNVLGVQNSARCMYFRLKTKHIYSLLRSY